MLNDVMLDIETAGRGQDALVIALGAVQFDAFSQDIGGTFEVIFDPLDVERTGGRMSMSTMLWWLKQNAIVRARMFGGTMGAREGLKDFSLWYKTCGPERVWANGTTFDIVILQDMFARLDMKVPWHYRDVRDMRFFRDIPCQHYKDEVQRVYASRVEHDAVEDAMAQARNVQIACKYLGLDETGRLI